MLNVILIGPQGSGKGTQAEKIIEAFGLAHIEAGALIRARAEKHDRKAEIIDHLANKKGQLLPDGIVLDMIYDELAETESAAGYLFDGFPRSVAQYEALTQLLSDRDMKLSAAVYLHLSDEESVQRLSSRRLCSACHKGYSLVLEPNRERCDCGGDLVKRADDEPEAIAHRLALFHSSTQPILDVMKRDGILREINGEQSVAAITEEIRGVLQSIMAENS